MFISGCNIPHSPLLPNALNFYIVVYTVIFFSFSVASQFFVLYKSVVHLTCNLLDNTDIRRGSRDIFKQANGKFGFCDPVVLTRLLLNYCMSLHGCALWSLYYCRYLDVCLI